MSNDLVATVFKKAGSIMEGERLSAQLQTGFVLSVYNSGLLEKSDMASILGIQESQLRKAFSKGNSLRPSDVRAIAAAVLHARQCEPA
jgi:hypothetical protein